MSEQIEKMNDTLHRLETVYWKSDDVFSYQWWTILILNIIFITLFVLLIDRKRIYQIALIFMICFTITGLSDEIGQYFGLWFYKHELVQFTQRFNIADFAVTPVVFALIFQRFHTWGKYMITILAASLIFSFVGLPLFVYLNVTKLNNWTYFNSFVVLIVTGVLLKIIMHLISRANPELRRADLEDQKYSFNLFRTKKRAR